MLSIQVEFRTLVGNASAIDGSARTSVITSDTTLNKVIVPINQPKNVPQLLVCFVRCLSSGCPGIVDSNRGLAIFLEG